MLRLWRVVALPVLLGFLILGAYLYFYLGANQEVTIRVLDRREFHLLLRPHIGPYHKVNALIVAVEDWARRNGVDCPETFGEYLDNPEQVDAARLRANVGCVLRFPLPKEISLPPEWRAETRSGGRFVTATFDGSPAIGPWRVYPRLNEYIARHQLNVEPATFEVYRITGTNSMTTEYLMRLVPSPAEN